MEIQWKAGQVKVNVAGRDGGPVRTKGRKKKAMGVGIDREQSACNQCDMMLQ